MRVGFRTIQRFFILYIIFPFKSLKFNNSALSALVAFTVRFTFFLFLCALARIGGGGGDK